MDNTRRALIGLAPAPLTPGREALRKRNFPDIVMQTHEGNAVRFYEDLVRDKIVIINFMYTNCGGTCPVTVHNLVQVQKRLGRRIGSDMFMYSITLDPENDTPAVLKKYARTHGVRPGWLYLRASTSETDILRRKLGFYSSNPVVDANRSAHAAMIRFGNESRSLWAQVSAFAAPEVIVRSILWVAPPSAQRAA